MFLFSYFQLLSSWSYLLFSSKYMIVPLFPIELELPSIILVLKVTLFFLENIMLLSMLMMALNVSYQIISRARVFSVCKSPVKPDTT